MSTLTKIRKLVEKSGRPVSVSEVAERIGVHHSTIERSIPYLQENGLSYSTIEDWLLTGK
jgi:predicted transcriptional regulator